MRNIKQLNLVKKVISVPSGHKTLREHGRILPDGNKFIFTSTVTRKVSGKTEYTTHYWISTDKESWQYKGKLNLPYKSEDLHLSKDGSIYIAIYENKSLPGFTISYAVCSSISGRFVNVDSYKYTPSMSGINKCLAVYSPLRNSALTLLLDWRTDDSQLNIENIGLVKWQSNKWGKIRTLMRPNDYGYDTLGVGGAIHPVGDEYVLELAAGIDYTPPPNKHIKFVNGLVLLDSDFNVKRMLNKILRDKDGNALWATFANDGDWFALSRKRGTQDIYLAEIVEKGSSEPQPNGGEMLNLKVAALADNKILLEWNHPDGVNNVHFENDIQGYFATKDVLADSRFEFTNNFNAHKFRVRAEKGSFEGWVSVKGTSTPTPEPSTNEAVKELMEEKLKEMEGNIIDFRFLKEQIK